MILGLIRGDFQRVEAGWEALGRHNDLIHPKCKKSLCVCGWGYTLITHSPFMLKAGQTHTHANSTFISIDVQAEVGSQVTRSKAVKGETW